MEEALFAEKHVFDAVGIPWWGWFYQRPSERELHIGHGSHRRKEKKRKRQFPICLNQTSRCIINLIVVRTIQMQWNQMNEYNTTGPRLSHNEGDGGENEMYWNSIILALAKLSFDGKSLLFYLVSVAAWYCPLQNSVWDNFNAVLREWTELGAPNMNGNIFLNKQWKIGRIGISSNK